MLGLRTLQRTRGAQRRALHLQPQAAAELVGKYLPSGSTSSAASAPGVPFKVIASRVHQAPTIEAADKVLKLNINSGALPPAAEVDAWLSSVGVAADAHAAARDVLAGVWTAWKENGAVRVTGTLSSDGKSISDVVTVVDDFTLPGRPDIRTMGQKGHPFEDKADAARLFYHKMDGNIACYGYGAGIAMSTMDALAAAGGKPANFLDGGGGATVANVRAAMDIILNDPGADVIFVNSFGGLTKMDLIAEEGVKCINELKAKGQRIPPIVMRLRGTGEEEAQQILAKAAVPEIEYIADMNTAAARAVEIAKAAAEAQGKPTPAPLDWSAKSRPVVFSRDGQYEQTIDNLKVREGDPTLVIGLGKASQANSTVAYNYGTNIVGAAAPKKGGTEFLGKPVFGGVQEAVNALRPRIASVFAPPVAAADSIIECIEAEIPLVVSYAEGVPQHDQLRVQAALRSQNKTRVIGANCPGAIFPHQRIKLGIQPLKVHSPGIVGLISRSGTISYDLAQQTTSLGLGQSAVFGLGGDPFPGTRSWEALKVLLEDPLTKIVCVVGETAGQMEEEVAAYYADYRANNPNPKPVVGFVAGAATERGKVYGHAGAVWWDPSETTAAKRSALAEAGIVMAPTIGDIGALIKSEVERLGLAPAAAESQEEPRVAFG